MSPEDEGPHPAGDDPDWQESAYLAWRDPLVGLGGNHRIGNEVNRVSANLWCGVYHEKGLQFRWNGEGLGLERSEGHGLAAGPQRLFHDGERLRFRLDTDECSLDLEVIDLVGSRTETTGAAFSGSRGQAGAVFSNNFHTFCRVRGSARIGDERVEVDAPAWRDHSWGVRRWDSFLASRSFGGSHGALQFRYGSMVGANGSFFRRGHLSEGGRELEVTDAALVVGLDDDSVRSPWAEARFRLAAGRVRTVRIDVIGGMVGVTGARYGWESVGDVSLDGEAGGWGFLEVNNNPRNGSRPPAFALGDALTNGLVRRQG